MSLALASAATSLGTLCGSTRLALGSAAGMSEAKATAAVERARSIAWASDTILFRSATSRSRCMSSVGSSTVTSSASRSAARAFTASISFEPYPRRWKGGSTSSWLSLSLCLSGYA